jgi:hypothetical protein
MKLCKDCKYYRTMLGKESCAACPPLTCREARDTYANICGREAKFYKKRRGILSNIWHWIFGGLK